VIGLQDALRSKASLFALVTDIHVALQVCRRGTPSFPPKNLNYQFDKWWESSQLQTHSQFSKEG
jgi:hypothetical protein